MEYEAVAKRYSVKYVFFQFPINHKKNTYSTKILEKYMHYLRPATSLKNATLQILCFKRKCWCLFLCFFYFSSHSTKSEGVKKQNCKFRCYHEL